jgi:hypothetical protein
MTHEDRSSLVSLGLALGPRRKRTSPSTSPLHVHEREYETAKVLSPAPRQTSDPQVRSLPLHVSLIAKPNRQSALEIAFLRSFLRSTDRQSMKKKKKVWVMEFSITYAQGVCVGRKRENLASGSIEYCIVLCISEQ